MKYLNEVERLRHEVSLLKKSTNRLRTRIVSYQATMEKRKAQATIDATFKKLLKSHDPVLYKMIVDKITQDSGK